MDFPFVLFLFCYLHIYIQYYERIYFAYSSEETELKSARN